MRSRLSGEVEGLRRRITRENTTIYEGFFSKELGITINQCIYKDYVLFDLQTNSIVAQFSFDYKFDEFYRLDPFGVITDLGPEDFINPDCEDPSADTRSHQDDDEDGEHEQEVQVPLNELEDAE